MVDKSLHFGNQNFFFVDSDETGLTYDYVAYINIKGSILLAQYNKAGTQGRYCILTGTYASIWTMRATQNYKLPNELEDPTV